MRFPTVTAGAVLMLAVTAGACSSDAPGTAAVSPTSAPSPSSMPATGPTDTPSLGPLEPVAARCDEPHADAETFWFRTRDGVALDGAVLGRGSIGVVLAHQYPADLCGGWPLAVDLSEHDVRVLLFDFRCLGESACPGPDADGSYVDDVDAAVQELRDRGVSRVFLVGASLGGTVSMMAGAEIAPPVAGVVSLSGEADLGFLTGFTRLDARSAVPGLRTPFLEIVARDDRYVPVADARGLLDAAGSSDKRLVILPSTFGHGWSMVTDVLGNPTRIARLVLDFVTAHTS